jgi:hypothetical protein
VHKPKEPVPEEKMIRHGNPKTNSICQLLREIYWMTEDQEIKLKLREATAMAKAMYFKLKEYKEVSK